MYRPEKSKEGSGKRGRPKKTSSLNTLLNEEMAFPQQQQASSSQPDDMAEILKQINECEMAMAVDESYARSLENDMRKMDLRDDKEKEFPKDVEMAQIMENIRMMEEIEKIQPQRDNFNPSPIMEARNIRAQQNMEYEEALLKDIEKERLAKIADRNRREEEEFDNAIRQSLEMAKVFEVVSEEEKPEDIPLTIEQMRHARLAYFSKK